MPQLLIRCPETEKPLSTGINCSKKAYENASFHNRKVSCFHCGNEHNWSHEDAFFKDELKDGI
jgi:RNase P subunit RPR2